MKIVYPGVTTADQNLSTQRYTLKRAGRDRLVEERRPASGRSGHVRIVFYASEDQVAEATTLIGRQKSWRGYSAQNS